MTEIRNLEAGVELDSLVAEKVMGWDVHFRLKPGERPHHEGRFYFRDPEHNTIYLPEQWTPSTDIGVAFEVAAKIGTNFVLEWIKDPKMFVAAPWPGTGPWIAGLSGMTCMRGETAAVAICRMALVAAEHQPVKR